MRPMLLMCPAAAPAEKGPPQVTVDGLEHIESENVDSLYAMPGTDFSGYDRVFLLAPGSGQ